MATIETPRLLTAAEAADRLGVSGRFIRDHRHQLGAVRLGDRLVRYPSEQLVERALRIYQNDV
jgi:excisionase family DNA binding protein